MYHKKTLPFLLPLFVLCFVNIAFSEVKTSVVKDVYVLPVAELAGTKTYPDIIQVENSLIKLELLPNRGRVIASFVDTTKNHSFLYNNFKPDPMVLPGGLHSVEFGGYYFSLPWNTRDRQPFDLSFEITKSTPEGAEIYLSGKDMFKKTLTECWVRIVDENPIVELEIKITNTSSKAPLKADFKDFEIVSVDVSSPGNPDIEESSILLPVNTVEIVSSKGNWLGQQGETLQWTDERTKWKNMKAYFNIITREELEKPGVTILYPGLNAAFVKIWEPGQFFNKIEVWSWGKNYKMEAGADAYFAISCIRDELLLLPRESISFKIYLIGLSDVSSKDTFISLYEKAKSYLE